MKLKLNILASRRSIIKIWLTLFLLSFLSVGSVYYFRQYHPPLDSHKSVVLRILALQGTVPVQVAQSFAAQTGIRLEIDEVDGPEQLRTRLSAQDAGRYDVISMFSFQVEDIFQFYGLNHLQIEKLKNKQNLLSDFQDLPLHENSEIRRQDLQNLVPVLWGVMGFVSMTTSATSAYQSSLQQGQRRINTIHLMSSPVRVLYTLAGFDPHDNTGTVTSTSALAAQASSSRLRMFLDSSFDDELENKELQIKQEVKKRLSLLSKDVSFLKDPSFLSMDRQHLDWESEKEKKINQTWQIDHGPVAYELGDVATQKLKAPWSFDWTTPENFFWVLYWGISSNTQHLSEAHQLIDFLLEKQTAREIIETTHHASTNPSIENESDLHAWLKPSYIRHIDLRRLVRHSRFQLTAGLADVIHEILSSIHPEKEAEVEH